MKRISTLLLLLFFFTASKATTFIVTVSNNQYSPANIPNVLVGDTIQFNFAASNFHNVTSIALGQVPDGAAELYSGGIGDVTTSYSYRVTVAGNYRYYCEAHSFDGTSGMVGTFSVSGVVPVQLKNFEASYSNKTVTATWQTASEQNLAYFSLQKSLDGKNYTEVGRVNASGTSASLQSYQLKDERIDMDARYVYYLLKMVDRDGKFSLSAVKLVRNSNASPKLITQVGPNPVSKNIGHLIFQFNADRSGSMSAWVLDASGRSVLKLELSANKGINNGHIHMSELPKGTYTVVFSMDGLKETKRVLVVD
jgi:plastocyanin